MIFCGLYFVPIFQLKHCCVSDPSDVYVVNVSGQNLTDAVSADFEMFQNVVEVNASDNLLSLGLLKNAHYMQTKINKLTFGS